MIGKQLTQTLKLVLTIAVAFIVLVVAQHALAQTQVSNTQVHKFESWDPNANPSAKWTTGNNNSYSEGQTIPMRLTLSKLITDTAYYFHFCLDIDQTPPWAFTKSETWTTTVEPPPPPAPGDLTMNPGSTEGVQAEASNVEGLTVSYLGIDEGGCSSGSRSQLSYLVNFTATASSSIFVMGGHVAEPGDTDPNNNKVGEGQGASAIDGTFQARTATTADKTLNFQVGEFPLQEVTVVKEVIGDNAPEQSFDISIACEEDSKRRNLWDGDRLTLDDIPVGTECTADEDDPGENWTVTIDPDPLTVTVDGPNVITVTNLYEGSVEKERPIAKRVKDKKVIKEPMCPYPPKRKHMKQRHKPHRGHGRW